MNDQELADSYFDEVLATDSEREAKELLRGPGKLQGHSEATITDVMARIRTRLESRVGSGRKLKPNEQKWAKIFRLLRA